VHLPIKQIAHGKQCAGSIAGIKRTLTTEKRKEKKTALLLTERPQKVYASYNYTCARSASKCRYLRRLYADFMRYYCARIAKCGQITTEPPRPPGIFPEFYPLGMGSEIGKNQPWIFRNADLVFLAKNEGRGVSKIFATKF
jgi:hypothetical protein